MKKQINLNGPDGNAFVLLGYAKSVSKQLNKDGSKILEEMMDGDYDHLVAVFKREFGNYFKFAKK